MRRRFVEDEGSPKLCLDRRRSRTDLGNFNVAPVLLPTNAPPSPPSLLLVEMRSGSARSGPHFPDVPPSFAAARSRRRHWGASVPASSSTTLPLRLPASTLARAATAVGDASKCSSDGGALAGPFIWSALAPSPTIALPLECTVGAVSFHSTLLKDGRGRDGGNR